MLKKIREKVLYDIGMLRYLYSKYLQTKKSQLSVMSIEETLQTIKEKKCSIIRFGDGEISIIRSRDLHFQKADEELKKGLIQILTTQDEKLLICIPDVFGDLSQYKDNAKKFQIRTLAIARNAWYKYCSKEYKYGNAFCSRWSALKDQNFTSKWYEEWFSLWEDEDVVVVEGELSRTGVGNPMFEKAKSVERILAPNMHAWDKYTEILNEILKVDNDKLILLALGPTAKILAYNLFKNGYRVLDIGHLDIGYETYVQNLDIREPIKGKFFLETSEEQDFALNDYNQYKQYRSEIRAIIKGGNIEK